MQRVIAHCLPREMAILVLIETTISFAAIYAVVTLTLSSAASPVLLNLPPRDAFGLATIVTLAAAATGGTIGLYRSDICLDRKRLLTTAGLAAAVSFAILLFAGPQQGAGFSAPGALPLAMALAAWVATITAIRLIYWYASGSVQLNRRILLIGEPEPLRRFKGRLQSRRGHGFTPVVLQSPEVGWNLAREYGVWAIVFVGHRLPQPTVAALMDCKFRGLRVFSGSAFQEDFLGRIDLDTLTADNLLMEKGFVSTRLGSATKRAIDVILAVAVMILALPLMLLTAVAIKADSRGPIFYCQKRVGQFDTIFNLYKFRSMTADAEGGGGPLWAQRHDSRITRVGRFIRATRIDELPQLVNVIAGEMSMVGPRPERPHFVEQLTRAIPFYRQRTYVKPGLTGWAQVSFPYGASVEDAREKLAYDLYYVKNQSILTDLVILFSTIRVVLFREGAR